LTKNKLGLEDALKTYRKDINQIDDKIIKLLEERGSLVQLIGKIKRKFNVDIYQPEREKEIIDRMKNKSKILNQENIESIWKEIIKASRNLQIKINSKEKPAKI
jgi:chorismate mutase